jgi:hypothetical protein
MTRTRAGNGLGSFPSGRRHQPLVARANEETARRLGITLPELLQVARDLEVWGSHDSGEPVYRFRELLAALGRLPTPGETPSHRGSRNALRNRKAAQGR